MTLLSSFLAYMNKTLLSEKAADSMELLIRNMKSKWQPGFLTQMTDGIKPGVKPSPKVHKSNALH